MCQSDRLTSSVSLLEFVCKLANHLDKSGELAARHKHGGNLISRSGSMMAPVAISCLRPTLVFELPNWYLRARFAIQFNDAPSNQLFP